MKRNWRGWIGVAVVATLLSVPALGAVKVEHLLVNAPPAQGQDWVQTIITECPGSAFGLSKWTYPGGHEAVVVVATFEEACSGKKWTYPFLVIKTGTILPPWAESWTPMPAALTVNGVTVAVFEGPTKPFKQ
jgi:hypothetical protein